jgi:hypothetical protein
MVRAAHQRVEADMSAARSIVLIAAMLVLSSCAANRSFRNLGKSVFDNGDVDVPARLIGCNGYNPGQSRTTLNRRVVSVDLYVSPVGNVDVATVAVSGAGIEPSVNELAYAVAKTCAFTPAMNKGEAVAVRLRTVLVVERPANP